MPAFVLLAREERAFWDNAWTGTQYALDIVATFSGVGSLIKAGRLLATLAKVEKLSWTVAKTAVKFAG